MKHNASCESVLVSIDWLAGAACQSVQDAGAANNTGTNSHALLI